MCNVTVATVFTNNTHCIMCVCVFVALIIQHVNRMLRNILSSVACTALPCFCTCLINETIVSVYNINLLFRSLMAIILLAR